MAARVFHRLAVNELGVAQSQCLNGRAFLGFRRSVGGVFAFRAAARARRPGGAGPRRPGPGALSLTNPIRGRLAAFFAAFAPKCISPHARGRSTALLLLQRERSCYMENSYRYQQPTGLYPNRSAGNKLPTFLSDLTDIYIVPRQRGNAEQF